MRFSFDPAKQAANAAKHGLMFSVVEGFEWETAVIEVDSRRTYGEPRLVAVGLIEDRVHVVVFSLRDTTVRLIGVRKANSREVKRYASQS
jgi:uncharacterized DUF497 family protein